MQSLVTSKHKVLLLQKKCKHSQTTKEAVKLQACIVETHHDFTPIFEMGWILCWHFQFEHNKANSAFAIKQTWNIIENFKFEYHFRLPFHSRLQESNLIANFTIIMWFIDSHVNAMRLIAGADSVILISLQLRMINIVLTLHDCIKSWFIVGDSF